MQRERCIKAGCLPADLWRGCGLSTAQRKSEAGSAVNSGPERSLHCRGQAGRTRIHPGLSCLAYDATSAHPLLGSTVPSPLPPTGAARWHCPFSPPPLWSCSRQSGLVAAPGSPRLPRQVQTESVSGEASPGLHTETNTATRGTVEFESWLWVFGWPPQAHGLELRSSVW